MQRTIPLPTFPDPHLEECRPSLLPSASALQESAPQTTDPRHDQSAHQFPNHFQQTFDFDFAPLGDFPLNDFISGAGANLNAFDFAIDGVGSGIAAGAFAFDNGASLELGQLADFGTTGDLNDIALDPLLSFGDLGAATMLERAGGSSGEDVSMGGGGASAYITGMSPLLPPTHSSTQIHRICLHQFH